MDHISKMWGSDDEQTVFYMKVFSVTLLVFGDEHSSHDGRVIGSAYISFTILFILWVI